MKKISLFLCAAIVALASCSQKESFLQSEDNSISFNVYTSSSTTKGSLVEKEDVYDGTTGGLGVFAFWQNSSSGNPVMFNTRSFLTPDFMYNQKVYSSDEGASWTYSPVKFWPNNTGDRLSFFAYAPYDEDMAWEDLSVSTDAVASKLTVNFSIADEASSQKDILWAEPKLNCTNKDDAGSNVPSRRLTFNFKHVTSKVDLLVGVVAGGSSPAEWNDGNTRIILKNIILEGLRDGFDYVYPISDGVLGSASQSSDKAGKFDLKLSPRAEIDTVNSANWKKDGAGAVLDENGWTKYLEEKSDGKGEYLFLAPQSFEDEKVTITYIVETKVSENSSSANDSRIENTVSKKLSDIIPEGRLQGGMAYSLKFLIGMDDVNISAAIGGWQTPKEVSAEFPKNDNTNYTISWSGDLGSVSATTSGSATIASGSVTDLAGTVVTLTASPMDELYTFVGWRCGTQTVSTDNPLELTLSKEIDGKQYVATYEE